MFRQILKLIVCLGIIVLPAKETLSQFSITSTTNCVIAGQSYTYTISGSWNSSTTMDWSIPVGHGTISGSSGSGNTRSGTPLPSIQIVWNSSVTSSTVSLTVSGVTKTYNVTITTDLLPGSITSSTSQTIAYGATPSGITCSVASGATCSPTYQYQWQSSADNVNWSDISGATSQNYSPGALTQTTYYRRKVTETVTSSVGYSNVVTVTVTPPFNPGTISPASATIAYNTSPGQLTGSAPTGGSCGGSYTYEWYKSTDNLNWGSSIATTANYTPGNLTITTYYKRKVFCSGQNQFTNTSAITVIQPLTGGTVTGNTGPITYSTYPGLFSSSSGATGGDCGTSYSYQWQVSLNGSAWNDITGATALTYTPGYLIVQTYYRRKVTCLALTAYSNTLTVQVNNPLNTGVITPSSATIPSGTSPGILTATPASGGSCEGSYTYQWQSSTDNNTWSNISGATAEHYTPGNLTVTTYYRRKVTCGTDQLYSTVTVIAVGTVDPENINYIRTREVTKAAVTIIGDANALTDTREIRQLTEYYDGLGRLMQTVGKKVSPLEKDMVIPSVYDHFGREAISYLPYASTGTDGKYKPGFIQEQYSFNNTQFAGEQFYFKQVAMEASPLSRVITSYAPGLNWLGSNRGSETKLWFNTAIDDVKKWTVTNFTNDWGTYSTIASYPTGELYKNVKINEHGKQVIEFIDKEGKLILKKVQLTATADNGSGSDYLGWICTYYVYDKQNNQRLVIQPKGIEMLIPNGWDITALSNAILDEQCFRYEYDKRNRLIRKKLPGTGEVYLVYDARDRLVMEQDANMRAQNSWIVTLYDELNRPTQIGKLLNTYSSNKTFQQHLTDAYGSIEYPFTESNVPSTTYWEFLNKTGYDNYTTIPGASGLTSTIDNTYTGSTYLYTTYNTSPVYAQQLIPTTRLTGIPTWTQTKVLGTASTYSYSVTIYDNYGRPIQVKTKNHLGGTDILTTQYNFRGLPIVQVSRSEKAAPNAQVHVITTKLDYDHGDRLLAVKKKVTSTGSVTATKAELEIVKNDYDELGQLKNKQIGKKKDGSGAYTITPVETMTYDYNIQGWLLGVNRSQVLASNGQDARYFGYELGYDKTSNTSGRNFSAAQYNGNITGIIWKSYGDGIRRKYDFTYDATNRLMQGLFEQNDAGSTWGSSLVNYTIKMGDGTDVTTAYDVNGNIKRMQQWGLKISGSTQIDDLRYSYLNGDKSNKLQNVIDLNFNDPQTKLGDFRSSSLYMTALSNNKTSAAIDYTYDVNGNLLKDRNKDIGDGSNDGITYNELNLPVVMTIRTTAGAIKGTITYTYDAAGNKLQKVVAETGQPSKTTLYLGDAIYENDVLQFLSQGEGRIRYTPAIGAAPAKYDYDYFIRDYLGNVRMVLTDEQQQDVYPAATLEGNINTPGSPNAIYTEKDFYSINAANVVDKSVATGITNYVNNNGNPPYNNNPNSSTGSNSQKLYKLTASAVANGGVTGLGITLKVMGGDKIDIFGKSYYFQNNTGTNNYAIPVSGILDGLLGTPSSPASGKTSSGELNGLSVITTAIGTFLADGNRNNGGSSTTPKAYINYILLDEQFRYVSGGFSRVGSANTVKSHYSDAAMQNINITKNGYLYVYVSNESPTDVFFDNLQVIHTRSAILEETHYYPFGLTMAGISSKAIGKIGNKYKFNNGTELEDKEFSDGSGSELYATEFRSLDPQIGRFHQSDPLAELGFEFSPYSFANNNPIYFNDPLGLSPDTGTNKQNLDAVYVVAKIKCKDCAPARPSPASAINPAGLPAIPIVSPLKPVPPPGKVVPFNKPDVKPIPVPIPAIVAAPLLTIAGVLWPFGGPSFPLNDENFLYHFPVMGRTYLPEDLIDFVGPPKPGEERKPLYFIRFGGLPESKEQLSTQALAAMATGKFPHGVSVFVRKRISGKDKTDHRTASVYEVMALFKVQKTGKNPDHFTVILPYPMTDEAAAVFNSIFRTQK